MKIKNLLFLSIATAFISACVTPENYQYSSSNPQNSATYQQQATSTLPYGLQKKIQRGQPLPPGWQLKLHRGSILDLQIYRSGEIVVPLDKHGLVTIRLEGKLIRLYHATRQITEILN